MRWRGGQRGGGGIEDRRGMGVGGIAGGGLGVTGLALLGLHARNRRMTWPLVSLGLLIPLILALIFIH